MRHWKVTTVALCLAALLLVACEPVTLGPSLEVESSDYPTIRELRGRSADTLTAEYVDRLKQKELDDIFQTEPYYPAYVTLTNGARQRLELCREDPRGATVFYPADSGCFVAFRNARDGGGVFYRSDPADGVPDTSLECVLSDRCVALYPARHPSVYAVTAAPVQGTCLYRLTPPTDGRDTCRVEKLIRVAEEATVVAMAAGVMDNLYVLTETGLYAINLGTWEGGENGSSSAADPATVTCTPIELPPEAHRLTFNSLVDYDGSLYIGTTHGVLAYNKDTAVFTWFPTAD